jgi:hypothetical protein
MTEQPMTPEVVHRAAVTRTRQEMFRPMRLGVDDLAKALAGDDADALSADEPKSSHPPVTCPTCGFIGPPRAVERHMRRRGHSAHPEPERAPNEHVAANPDYDAEPLTKAALVGVLAATPDKRHTLVVVTPDQFGTDPQSFQHRVWKSRVEGNKALTDDDGRLLGRVVEVAQWPFPAQPSALVKDRDSFAPRTLPGESYYVGVVWEPGAWTAYRRGDLSPAAVVAEAFAS